MEAMMKVEPTSGRRRAAATISATETRLGANAPAAISASTTPATSRPGPRLLRPRHRHLGPSAGRLTFAAWAKAYLDQKVSLRQRTKDRYESELRAYLIPCLGDRAMFTIARSDVQAFIVSLVGRGLAPATIRGIYSLLAAILRLAEEKGLISQTPCRRISLPPLVTNERRYLSAEEVERLVSAIPPHYEALIYTAADLGLRWHEVAGLRRRYVELSLGRPASLRVVSTIERSGGSCRVVDLGKTKAARRTLTNAGVLARLPGDASLRLSRQRVGVPRPQRRLSSLWQLPHAGVDARGGGAKLQSLTFHCLSHTAAAFMIDDGAEPFQLKRRMGHEDIPLSLDTYGHLFAQREDALVNALERRSQAALESFRRGRFLVTATRHGTVSLNRERASEQGI